MSDTLCLPPRHATGEGKFYRLGVLRDHLYAGAGASSNNVLLIHTQVSPPMDQSSFTPGAFCVLIFILSTYRRFSGSVYLVYPCK